MASAHAGDVGLDFDGGDIEGLGDKSSLKDDVPMLVAEASAIERCVAFNTNGWLKSDVPPRSRWKRKQTSGTKHERIMGDTRHRRPTAV